MEKQILKHEVKFKKWLPNNKVTAVNSYMSYLREAAQATGHSSIDDFLDKIVRNAIKEALNDEKFESKKKANDSRAAVKKYWSFLRQLGKATKIK
jgi:hypothetical protein